MQDSKTARLDFVDFVSNGRVDYGLVKLPVLKLDATDISFHS